MPLDFKDDKIWGGVHLRIKEVGPLVESQVVTRIMERRIKGLEWQFLVAWSGKVLLDQPLSSRTFYADRNILSVLSSTTATHVAVSALEIWLLRLRNWIFVCFTNFFKIYNSAKIHIRFPIWAISKCAVQYVMYIHSIVQMISRTLFIFMKLKFRITQQLPSPLPPVPGDLHSRFCLYGFDYSG